MIVHELEHDWPVSLAVMTALWLGGIVAIGWLLSDKALSRPRYWGLLGLRCCVVSLLLLLIGNWRIVEYETELPDVLLLFDRSQSMTLPGATSDRRQGVQRIDQLRALFQNDSHLLSQLSQRFRARTFAVGSRIVPMEDVERDIAELSATDQNSRLGSQLIELADQHSRRPVSAAVLFTDGAVTDDVSLESAAEFLRSRGIPLWCIAFGNQNDPLDVSVDEIIVDPKARIGDLIRISVRLYVSSETADELNVALADRQSKRILQQKTIPTPSSGLQSLDFFVKPDQIGTWQLEAIVEPLADEVIPTNNRQSFDVVVHDDPIRVLLIAQQPSYEFRFLKHSLERRIISGSDRHVVDLTSVLQEGDPRYAAQDRAASALPPVANSELEALDVIILCAADTVGLGEPLLNKFEDLVRNGGTGLLYIAGPSSNPSPTIQRMLPAEMTHPIPPPKPLEDEARASLQTTEFGAVHPVFRTASSTPWSPVSSPHWHAPVQSIKPGAQILLERMVDSSQSEPIVVTHSAGLGRVWMQLTDESFRFLPNQNGDSSFDQYWMRVLNELARTKRAGNQVARFELDAPRYSAGEPIELRLHLPELVQFDRVPGVLRGRDGFTQDVEFFKSEVSQHWQTMLDGLPPGNYQVQLANSVTELEALPLPCVFSVFSDGQEDRQPRMQWDAMQTASQIAGGKTLLSSVARDTLVDQLPSRETSKLRPLGTRHLWNAPVTVMIVLTLISADWYLRRRWGLP